MRCNTKITADKLENRTDKGDSGAHPKRDLLTVVMLRETV
jgi:hypothetical protein